MHRPSLPGSVFRYLREPSRDLAGALFMRPGGAHGIRPFAVLLPPAGVGTSPSLGPTCRLSVAPRDARAYVARRTGRLEHFTHVSRATGRGHRPQLLGFVPAGDPSRTVHHAIAHARHRISHRPGVTALGFSSLRSSDAGLGYRLRPLPLVGFADVSDVMKTESSSRRVVSRRPPVTSLTHRPFSDQTDAWLFRPTNFHPDGKAPCLRFCTVWFVARRRLRRTVRIGLCVRRLSGVH